MSKPRNWSIFEYLLHVTSRRLATLLEDIGVHTQQQKTHWMSPYPFKSIQGNSPISVPVTFSHTRYPSIEEKMKWMIDDREEALATHELARTRIANRKQSNFIPFEKDQKVRLNTRNLKMNHHKKIAPKWEGPFEVEEVLGPVTYRLKLPTTWKIHNMFHVTLLRPYIKNKIYGNNYPRPLPKLLEGEEVYEVETILKHWWRGRGYQYHVKWKGYLITKVTWESESAFSDNGNMLQTYKDQYQLWNKEDLFLLDNKRTRWKMQKQKNAIYSEQQNLYFYILSFNWKKSHVIWTRIEQTAANTEWQHTWTVLLLPVLNIKNNRN